MTRPFVYTPEQEAWLHDLETTTAKQGVGSLHSLSDEFCCLGRSCILFRDKLEQMEERKAGDKYRYLYVDLDKATDEDSYHGAAVPENIRKLLHLHSALGEPRRAVPGSKTALYQLNDIKKLTFKEIAAVIRSNPWVYFVRDAHGAE